MSEMTSVEEVVEKLRERSGGLWDGGLAELMDEAADLLSKLSGEVERAREVREALRPFASLGAALPEHYPQDSRYHGPGHPRFWYEIVPEDIWRARAVLDAEERLRAIADLEENPPPS